MVNPANPDAHVGDIEIGRRLGGGWYWTVVVDEVGTLDGKNYPMSGVGGWTRTMPGAAFAAWRHMPRHVPIPDPDVPTP